RRHGRGQAARVLVRRLIAVAEMHLAVQVEEDPDVGRTRLLEGLRHQSAVMRGERPVDAAEAVPGRVVAHAAGLGWVVGPGAEARRRANLLRAGGQQVWDRPHAWIDEHGRPFAQPRLAAEQAERLLHPQGCRSERHPATPAINAAGLPGDAVAAYREHTAGLVVGDLTEVANLQPRRRHPAGLAHAEDLLERLADRRRTGVQPAREGDAADDQAGPGPRDYEKQREGIGERVARADRGQVREEKKQADEKPEGDLAHVRVPSVAFRPGLSRPSPLRSLPYPS